jgi:hypothetical protein
VPKYLAEDALGFYYNDGPLIFKPNGLHAWGIFTVYFLSNLFFGGLFFMCGWCRYNNSRKHQAFREMQDFLRQATSNIDPSPYDGVEIIKPAKLDGPTHRFSPNSPDRPDLPDEATTVDTPNMNGHN